jgi:6-pyruvoyltetrahydropterin/6-carboxytetrahydropterin synthase
MVYLTRRYRFSAAHRLDAPELSAEENARVYGKCNNPHGHGHNYVLDVTVAGRVDGETGMVCDLGFLDSLVRREVLDRFDETNLNLDTESFRDRVPTSENICLEIHRLLEPHLEGAGPGGEVRLARVRLEETTSNSIEYFGGHENSGPAQKVSS